MAKEPVSFREMRYQDTRRKILKNAARIFARKGYEKSSLEEIAARLKLSKGSLYHYIKSKDELLYLIQLQAIEEAITNINTILATESDPVRTLYQVIKGHVRTVTQNHVIGALRQQELILPRKWRSLIIEARDRLEALLQDIVVEGIDSGDFEARDSKMACISTLGVLNGVIRWYSPQGRMSVDEIGECVADFILKGFGVSPTAIAALASRETQPETEPGMGHNEE
ncbi:TetR/AcrR family transcriptional regulator [bacterium]|nr:TetR/AcrR family transcriptional regulator [bacterium]